MEHIFVNFYVSRETMQFVCWKNEKSLFVITAKKRKEQH